MHIGQNKFESIQLKNIQKHIHLGLPTSHAQHPYCHMYGYNAELTHRNPDSNTLLLQPNSQIDNVSSINNSMELTCDYLISAEGAHSSIREKLKIQMEGHTNLQHLMNVHFTCPGLRSTLSTRPGMLYFVFNQVSNIYSIYYF